MSVTEAKDPIQLFQTWLADAEKSEPVNPSACALATANAAGRPSVRMVLLKAVDERGFVFYTNLKSQKGRDLAANAQAEMCFYWKSLGRQVRVGGAVEQVSDDEADAYFETRDRGAQLGAWASKQSQVMDGAMALEKRVAKTVARFPVGAVPRPDFWSGYRIVPATIEFWDEGKLRLHDRWVYHRGDDGWTMERLYP